MGSRGLGKAHAIQSLAVHFPKLCLTGIIIITIKTTITGTLSSFFSGPDTGQNVLHSLCHSPS